MVRDPIEAMGLWLRRFVTFVVPLASIARLSAVWLFGKPMPFGLLRLAAWSGRLVAAVLVVIAGATWAFAVGHHCSTGS